MGLNRYRLLSAIVYIGGQDLQFAYDNPHIINLWILQSV